MAIVLLIKPAGLFGQGSADGAARPTAAAAAGARRASGTGCIAFVGDGRVLLRSRRSCVYPVFLMKVLCFALFACAFNLLLGYRRAAVVRPRDVLGMAGYVAAHAAKVWGLTPELAILLGTARAARARPRRRRCSPSAARASTSR